MINTYKLFYTEQCFNCPIVKEYLLGIELKGEYINASKEEGLKTAREMDVIKVPTVVFLEGEKEVIRAYSVDDCKSVLEKNA